MAEHVKDFQWHPGMRAADLAHHLGSVGFQATNIERAAQTIIKMKKAGAKIFLTFTSNMVTSGLRGFFAQLITLGIPDIIVTTAGGLEEDIMKAYKEKFHLGDFTPNDMELYEKGHNRVGNIYIPTESYAQFETIAQHLLQDLYKKQKTWTVSELLHEIGLTLNDEHSILYQAARHNIPIFCPAITDGAFGFHLYLFQQDHNDFHIDIIKDFANILLTVTPDDKKGIIALGGSISKHHAILAGLLNGGMDYAVYMTTAHSNSGSMSGATTNEAKSWGKLHDDTDAVTVNGDVTITFPLMMSLVLETLHNEKNLQP